MYNILNRRQCTFLLTTAHKTNPLMQRLRDENSEQSRQKPELSGEPYCFIWKKGVCRDQQVNIAEKVLHCGGRQTATAFLVLTP